MTNDHITSVSSEGGALMVENVYLEFDQFGQRVVALNGISLHVPHGQWLILAGANGSGKSSLFHALVRMVSPQRGRICVDGVELQAHSVADLARRIYLVHQQPLRGTAPDLTLFENLLVADEEAFEGRSSLRTLQEKYSALLRPLALDERLSQLVRTLSGGERQMLALAVARLRRSKIVLLDEPLAALAPQQTARSLTQIAELSRSGTTVVQIVHDPDLALSLGDRTVVMKAGKVVYDALGTDRTSASSRFWVW
jgi:putative tryptophan/tyrosine transport system ATP-binding protein